MSRLNTLAAIRAEVMDYIAKQKERGRGTK